MAFSCKHLIFIGIVVALAVAYQARAMPPPIISQVQQLLLSERSGRFVSVASDGAVTAQARPSGKV